MFIIEDSHYRRGLTNLTRWILGKIRITCVSASCDSSEAFALSAAEHLDSTSSSWELADSNSFCILTLTLDSSATWCSSSVSRAFASAIWFSKTFNLRSPSVLRLLSSCTSDFSSELLSSRCALAFSSWALPPLKDPKALERERQKLP